MPPQRQRPGGFGLGILSRLRLGSGDSPSKKAWRRYFEARLAVTAEWYGISKEEVLDLVACKMREGYTGDDVFDAVKRQLESRKTRILERA